MPVWAQDILMWAIFIAWGFILYKFMLKPFALCSRPYCWHFQGIHYIDDKPVCDVHREGRQDG